MLYQWFNTYTHFSCTLKTIVGFPFSLVLSISYLDHFRGISSRRSPSISPLLVNEKVVDHFFEIDDKKRKRRRGGRGKRSEESISGLKTRSARFISKPVSLLSAPVFRVGWWRSLTLLYRQGKNPGRIYLPSSISNTGVQYLEVERRGQKNDAQVVQLIFPCWISYSLKRWLKLKRVFRSLFICHLRVVFF